MRFSLFCYLSPAALALALPASPAFAHVHHHHHALYHHYRYASVAAAQQNCGGFFGAQFPCQFGTATPALQPSVASPQFNVSGGSYRQSTSVSAYGGMASAQAGASGVPQSLINRVIMRESGGNPRAVSRGNYGLMQIRLSTARAMGYTGSAAGLLDPQTNMTYAVRYLAGAYRAAGGNEARAIALYSRGYYYQAKRQGFSPYQASAAPSFPSAAPTFPGTAPQTNGFYAYASAAGPRIVHRVRRHRHYTA